MKEQIRKAMKESSVEGHMDLEDLTNKILDSYNKIYLISNENLRIIESAHWSKEAARDEMLRLGKERHSIRFLVVELDVN
mgnify:CR=1 FL=1